MEEINRNIRMKKEMAYWVKQFAFMKEAEFNDLDTSDFTMIQRITLNCVEKSKTDTKTAEKIVSLVHWYDTNQGLELY